MANIWPTLSELGKNWPNIVDVGRVQAVAIGAMLLRCVIVMDVGMTTHRGRKASVSHEKPSRPRPTARCRWVRIHIDLATALPRALASIVLSFEPRYGMEGRMEL